jgi:hypothetical protein
VLDRFAREFLAELPRLDLLAVWFNHHENRIAEKYSPQALLCGLTDLEPYYHPQPWSSALAGKSVVVVHPFAESIKAQYYKNRAFLFKDSGVLPEFKLTVVQAVQSLLLIPSGYQSWFEALDAMKKQIAKIDFDCAIIGAGGYGLPLATFVKTLGKTAVQMAGATQILFGIKGKRWDTHPIISQLFNEAWTRPSPAETPATAGRVESGCYW